ncbi:hypothetical protein C8R43DRAFT_1240501 [Mycena crocata]|nr:hypothetical protein C8R43DRAFT_1240501 [Mycena crocata]
MSRSGLKLLNTKLTRLLGIKSPVILPPMAGAAGGELAGQVSVAGGFGFLSAGYGAPDEFKQQLSLARSAFKAPLLTAQVPVGVGYLAWQLEKPNSTLVDLLPLALENNVQAVWFAFGEDLGRWIQFVREHDTRMGKEGDQKTKIFRTVRLFLEPEGCHLAAILTLGGAGAVLGTRFLLAYESLYSDAQRKALVSATSDMSVRSMAWDHARESLGWPAGIDGRGLRNSTVNDFENNVDIEILKSKFKEGIKNQDTDRIIVWSGTGIGQMNQIQTAKSIVEEVHEECIAHLAAAAKLYS